MQKPEERYKKSGKRLHEHSSIRARNSPLENKRNNGVLPRSRPTTPPKGFISRLFEEENRMENR